MNTLSNKPLTFDELPSVVAELCKQVQSFKDFLQERAEPVSDQWMNLDQLIEYLPQHPAKPTVYAWVGSKLIPYHKGEFGGKKLYFLKSEIDA